MGRVAADDGYASVVFPFLIAVAACGAIAILDLMAYVSAGSQAHTAADMAALAAAADADGTTATQRARMIAQAHGATVTRCACDGLHDPVTVTVELPVHALALPKLGGARYVRASASARVTR